MPRKERQRDGAKEKKQQKLDKKNQELTVFVYKN
jgi:hypothetical protein